jgi:ribonuclease Z
MGSRSLTVLGTASQAPTRHRNHNGYVIRFDDQLFLFDPGEGIQRQATIAGIALARLDVLALTHFHGDHCLGLPGVIQTVNGQRVTREIAVYFPEAGREYFDRLRYASEYGEHTPLAVHGIDSDGPAGKHGELSLIAHQLDHRTTTYGYRIDEPDGDRLDQTRLDELGLSGPVVGELIDQGEIEHEGATVELSDVSVRQRGQSVALVMDTRPCEGALRLASGVDMLICESTFLEPESELADRYCHMTAAQAGQLAASAGVRLLVLTHFSQRYPSSDPFIEEAAAHFDGPIIAAADFDVIDVPPRV